MARRRSDGGVEECKGYSPPNDHTTSASSTPLPLDSWYLNAGTTRLCLLSLGSWDLKAGTRSTSLLPTALCVRFVVLTDAVTRLAWQQHQASILQIIQQLSYTQPRLYITVLIEYTVVHTVQSADTSLLFECTILHSQP